MSKKVIKFPDEIFVELTSYNSMYAVDAKTPEQLAPDAVKVARYKLVEEVNAVHSITITPKGKKK